MKKFLIGFVLPAITALAVVGSGFSVWAFEKENKSEALASIEVTQLAKIGTFKQAETSVLRLDQTLAGRPSDIGEEFGASGIYLHKFKGKDVTVKNNSVIRYLAPADGSDYVVGSVKTEIKTYFFLKKALARYVKIVETELGKVSVSKWTGDSYSYSDALSYSKADYDGYVLSWDMSEKTASNPNISLSLPSDDFSDREFAFEYQDGMEPKNEEEYLAMVDALKDLGTDAMAFVSEANLVSWNA